MMKNTATGTSKEDADQKKGGLVIAILSGKGGVGKTTISLNLAKELSRRGPVWLIDVDLFNRGATSALWESEKQIPLSVAELILDAQDDSIKRGDEQALAARFTKKLTAAADSLAYDKRLTFVPAARAIEGKEASYVLWHGMAARGIHAEVFLAALAHSCATITPGCIVILDGHGGLDELSLAAAVISDTCYIVNEPDLITFTGSVTLFREIVEQADHSPHETWVEFIINRVSPHQRVATLEAEFGPMLDAMSPAPEPVAVYFPLEKELFGVFGQDPFVSDLYTRYWFSRKIKFLAERVVAAGMAAGSLDSAQWKAPKGSRAQKESVRTALRRELHKRGDFLLVGWLVTITAFLGTWVWSLLQITDTFKSGPPSALVTAIWISLGLFAIATLRWFGVQREHLANIKRLRGKPSRRLRFGDTESARAREEVESAVKTRSAARPLVTAGCVMAILGILIAITVPNLLTAMARSKQKRTMADMRSIATAWEARATDVNKYNAAGSIWPTYDVPFQTLSSALSPTYMRQIPEMDGWGKPFVMAASEPFGSEKEATSYLVQSYGADGKPERRLNTPPTPGTTNFDCDLIYQDGTFTRYPDGIQAQ